MFFDNWADLVRVVVKGVLAYGGLIVVLRVSGKRTLSKMNAFDLVVTVALGSTLATVLLSKSVALAEGLLAFAVLVALQFIVTWSSARSSVVSRLVKNEPKLLFYEGRYLRDAMRAERLTEEEVEAAVRQQGIANLEKVGAAVLETDGSVTVVPRQADLGSASALRRVSGLSVVLVATLMIVLAGCGESERAKDGAEGSQVTGAQTAAEHTADEKTVKNPPSGRRAAAGAGDAEARAGEGAVARAGDAVARAGPDAAARAGDAEAQVSAQANDGEEVKGTGADVDGTLPKVTVEVKGERGTMFSGTCSVGYEEERVGGRVPQSYSYEPDGEKLECEIRKNGPGALEVVVTAGDDVYSVQRQTGASSGTINTTYSGNRASGVASSAIQVNSVVSSVVSSTKSR